MKYNITPKKECFVAKTKMRRIGRWYIGETLGKGGYSWMKQGFDVINGKCVVLKFMAKADESWANEQKEQVMKEIEILRNVRHPNVLRLYSYNLNARYPTKKNDKIDTVLLVLQHARYGEIFDILYYHTSPLQAILVRTYFMQCIFGLAACHNAGIFHGNIKPENLLFDSGLNIKLTDFGLSKVFEYDADVGIRGYQAPELLLDKPYDFKCDIFSMGVILFILLTGYPPFEEAHYYKDRWFRPLAKGDYNKFWKYHDGSSISNNAKCKDLIQKMLCYDPKQRITINEIRKHPWFNGEYVEGKELLLALRKMHIEIEAKRRRDSRKIKDLTITIVPCRCSHHSPSVPIWDKNKPEQILSNTYAHFKDPGEFFLLLRSLIEHTYHGRTQYTQKKAQMICTISKMEKSKSSSNAIKSIQRDYKFEICLFKSVQYKTIREEKVYVVTTKRLQGDSYKFRGFQRNLLLDGAIIFNGLPEWALKNNISNHVFDKILKNWDLMKEIQEIAVFGFVRQCQHLLSHQTDNFWIIPPSIISICMQYFGIQHDDYHNIECNDY